MLAQRGAVIVGCWAVLGGAAAIVAQSVSSNTESFETDASSASTIAVEDGQTTAHPRLREGIRLHDAPGHFESAAEVPVFVDDEGRRLFGLENLNLQRIVRTVRAAEDPVALKWKVSGAITEYEGRNFIFIERATYSPSRQ